MLKEETSNTTTQSAQSVTFSKDGHGFLRQDPPIMSFSYSLDYKRNQSTNSNMAYLRLGWLSAHIPYEELRRFSVVDVGAGNYTFVSEGKKVFKTCVPYDLNGDSISKTELYSTSWDLIVLTDVLEHYNNVDDLWDLKFKYALISYPEQPPTSVMPDLTQWRHYKIHEHLYIFNKDVFRNWVQKNGCVVIAEECPEDMIRKRWDYDCVNITTFLLRNTKI